MLILWSHHLYGRNYTDGPVGSGRIVGPIRVFRVSLRTRQLYGRSYTGGPDSSRRIVCRQTLSKMNKKSRWASIFIWAQLYGQTKLVPPYSWSLNSQYLEQRNEDGVDSYTGAAIRPDQDGPAI